MRTKTDQSDCHSDTSRDFLFPEVYEERFFPMANTAHQPTHLQRAHADRLVSKRNVDQLDLQSADDPLEPPGKGAGSLPARCRPGRPARVATYQKLPHAHTL